MIISEQLYATPMLDQNDESQAISCHSIELQQTHKHTDGAIPTPHSSEFRILSKGQGLVSKGMLRSALCTVTRPLYYTTLDKEAGTHTLK